MAESLGTAVLELLADAKQLHTELAASEVATEESMATMGGSVGRWAKAIGGAMVAAFAVEKITEFVGECVRGAEQLQKSEEVIDETFGKSAGSVKEFGESAAAAFGVSAASADATSAKFGILFENMGVGKQAAADMTIGWEELAGSIAKIRGIDPSDVMDKMTLAAQGNTRGLKELGITINSHMEQVQAMKDGYGDTVSKLSAAEKATVIYQLATANLSTEMARAKEHSSDLRDQQAVLTAEWSNAKDELGMALLPAISAVTGWLANNLPAGIAAAKHGFEEIKPVIQAVIDVGGALVSAVRDNWSTIKPLVDILKTTIQTDMKVIADVLHLVADLLHGDFSAAWRDAKALVSDVVHGMVKIVSDEVEAMKSAATKFGNAAKNGIEDIVGQIAGWMHTEIGNVWHAVRDAADDAGGAAKNFGSAILNGIENTTKAVVGWMESTIASTWHAIRDAAGDAAGAAEAFGAAILRGIGKGLEDLGSNLVKWIVAPINAVIGALDSIHIPGFNVSIPIPSVDTHIPGVGKVGGGDISFGFGGLDPFNIPKIETGGYIVETGLAIVHRGETVVPSGAGGNGDIVMVVNGRELARISRAEFNRQARAGAQLFVNPVVG